MMNDLLLIITTGLILGLEHALEPDHLVAVSVFVTERKNLGTAARLGISWGLGHTATLLLIGGGAMILGVTIPPILADSMELLVGVLLVILGLHALYKVYRERVHLHQHQHVGEVHAHFHTHAESTGHHHEHRHTRRAFLVGLLHGGAGSAAALLLVLTMVDQMWQGLLFILLFGLGSVVGMLLVSLMIGLATRFATNISGWQRMMGTAAGALSIVLGVSIMLRFLAA
jgi:ABC-type nickel/cobalt efflux system permease component RcnA